MIASKRSIKLNIYHTCANMVDPSQNVVTIMIHLKKLTQELIHLKKLSQQLIHLKKVVTRIDSSQKAATAH